MARKNIDHVPTKLAGAAPAARITLKLFIVLSLAACSVLEDKSIAKARQLILSELRDAGSAHFRNLRKVNAIGFDLVCGEVNARNGFGGYVGFERFVVATDPRGKVRSYIDTGQRLTPQEVETLGKDATSEYLGGEGIADRLMGYCR